MTSKIFGLAAASVLLLTIAGCSAPAPGGGAAGGSTTSSTKATTPAVAPPSKTYTAADLQGILTNVKKTLGSDGTIVTDAQLKKLTTNSGGLSGLLTKSGITFKPAACAQLIQSKLPTAANGFGLGGSAIGAALTSKTGSSLGLSSAAGKALPASVTSTLSDGFGALTSACSSMKISIKVGSSAISIAVKLTQLAATSKADQTVGVQETLTVPATAGTKPKPITVTIVEARKGNLLISVTDPASTATSVATLSNEINTVIAAADSYAG
jgi:hypothetical protein